MARSTWKKGPFPTIPSLIALLLDEIANSIILVSELDTLASSAIPGRMEAMRKARLQDEATKQKSLVFTYAFNKFYVEMSRMITEWFDGDIDTFFVLVAIADASISQVLDDPVKARKYASIHTRIEEDYRFIKLLPLAEITGLPRTTVRRKALRLIEMGYVEHLDGEGYRVVKQSMVNCPSMRRIIQSQLALVSRLFNVMLGGEMIAMSSSSPARGARPA